MSTSSCLRAPFVRGLSLAGIAAAVISFAHASHRQVHFTALWLAIGSGLLVSGCGGGGGSGSGNSNGTIAGLGGAASAVPGQSAPLVPLAVASERGTSFNDAWAAYGRLVRLERQVDSRLNGRIVASLTEIVDGRLQAGFHVSTDDGLSFSRLGALIEPDFAKGLCCGTLFELPQPVGVLAAGTLLYAASVGQDGRGMLMENRIYRSDDAGATFRLLVDAHCGTSTVPRASDSAGSGVWEPEFFVAADGSLGCIFSDETEAGKSQVLKLTSTRDGLEWSRPHVIVAGSTAAARPGMAGVRRLPSGRYVMSFETCSLARLDCSVHLKLSPDGLEWGATDDMGTQPRTADGLFFRHSPTLTWTRTPTQPAGALVLMGQIVANGAGGVDTASNGHALFVDAGADGAGPWRLLPAPLGLPSAPLETNWCQNYSSPLLPTADGLGLVMIQTDRLADGGCSARFGRGPLG